ncbi:hypothetical protein [Nocardioides sp. NPDC047086]|uniref:hypothetical protein n=1 Tax=Nocardioides sp. NPDC047086 TaxID=3154810 RepID=UPI00340CFBDF
MSNDAAATREFREPTEDDPVTTADRPSRGRSIAAVICLVLAGVLMTPAAVAYWGQRTLNDAERYVETVGPLVESPEVQDVIATRVTAAIQQQVDVEAILTTVFAGVIDDAPRLERLVAPLAAAINSLVEREVRAFIASDEFADIWVRVNTRAQQTLQRLLNGDDTGAVSLQSDEVVLDVDEVIERVKERLVARGLTIVENVPIPETDRQIVLMEAPQLRQVRTIYAFSNPVAQWLLPVVGVLFLAALVLARRRPRMAVWIGAVVAANALLLALVLSIGEQLFINALAGTDFGPASRIFFDTLLSYLERGQQVVLWIGLVIVLAGWFASSNRYGTAARTTTGRSLENLGAGLAAGVGDGTVGGAGRWVAANVAWMRVAVVVLGGVVLLWGNEVTMSRFWWSLALVIGLLVVLQVLVGAGRSREPTASLDPGSATAP